jgi:FKBP-type peptidyl-prolyl cis-trans isomerase FklB
MKNVLIILACSVLLFGVFCSGKKQTLKDEKEKESYSLGFRFGENMKFQKTELDLEVYMSGLRDALEGREPKMTGEEIRTTIANLQQKLASSQQKAQQEQAGKNLAEGNAYLEENAKKEGVKTLPSGLQYKVLSDGSGRTPQKTDTVTVHYRGTFINGTEFDSSYGRGQPQTFRVDGVIPGWTEALQLMKEGAKWQVVIPPQLAYGERGMPPRIPANSVLVFEVELISIQ